MLFHHNDHRRDIRTLTTSRLIDATPRHLAQTILHPGLFRLAAVNPQRPPLVAIDLDPTPNGHGAVTLHCPHSGISELRPLRTRHTSPTRLTADTGGNVVFSGAGETPALALTIDLTPLVRPGPTLATRVTLSVNFVREPWWPNDLTHTLGSLPDLWLRRLEKQARDGQGPPDLRTRQAPTRTIALLAPIPSPPSV
ncbi:hypothetical protein MKK64_19940 [Methylobacterium sp. E-025]|uniref:hypothetical protein n=1 Tax=Methylobacterium sp. E-025 TaxID=2836561 RepID=UPI001FB97827|nr:hypothetical protein [Methylobacterium sp. E-025]MCJ2113447.1 hypothetical protein [Methylobacterium sp. E-025]